MKFVFSLTLFKEFVCVHVWWCICDSACVTMHVWQCICDSACVIVHVCQCMCDNACVHVVHSDIYLLLPNFKNLNFSQAIKKLMLALKLIIWIKYEKWNNSNRCLVISSSSVHRPLLPFLCHPGQVFGLHGRIRARFHFQFLQRWVGECNNGKLIFQRYLF